MPISGRELAKVFEKAGWTIKGQRGSHLKLEKAGKVVIIPLHRELKKGTEMAIRKSLKRDEK
jgi:predicted RNA binding protein YcfA (HicA-like mRNA interferase family)